MADIHTLKAAELFGIPPYKVTPKQRAIAKEWNFYLTYQVIKTHITKKESLDGSNK